MVEVASQINCSHCGAPLPIQSGEILVTCNYCGFTSVIETGKAFEFEHSLIMNTLQADLVFARVRNWMSNSFMAPKDFSKKFSLAEQSLVYLPFWVVSGEASTQYKGIFERITPAVEKDGEITNQYDWLVLARRESDFPTRAYHISLSGKIPFEATKVEKGAKVLNSEKGSDEAVQQAKDEIQNLHEYLAKEKVDRVVDVKTSMDVKGTYYLHSPVWFITYLYKNSRYQVLIDGASGDVIKGDVPKEEFKLF
jgi:hypothetical protein